MRDGDAAAGISPTSRTICTLLNWKSTTSTEGTTIASSRPKLPSLVRGSTTARTSVRTARASDRQLICPALASRSRVCATLLLPCRLHSR